jgi:hypothetical protein
MTVGTTTGVIMVGGIMTGVITARVIMEDMEDMDIIVEVATNVTIERL